MNIAQRYLIVGPHRIAASAADPGAAPYIVAGERMYALGYGSAEIGPIGVEHLVGEMGGIWAHPCKVADGIAIAAGDSDGTAWPAGPAILSERLAEISWEWQSGPLRIRRRDRVLPGAAAYAVQVEIANSSAAPVTASLHLRAPLYFLGCWFGGIATGGARYWRADNLVLGQDGIRTAWGVALGAAQLPDALDLIAHERGSEARLRYDFTLGSNASASWQFLLTVGLHGGAIEAEQQWHTLIGEAGTLFSTVADLSAIPGVPQVAGGDLTLSRDVALAQANLQLLRADYPDTGPYFLAGLPEYPQLFGCDTTYTIPGAVAGGFAATARSALATLARYAERACGRVPHEITTNGRVFHPGNIQETPQLVIAVWDYLRWTGDLELARRLFPLCREGLTELVPAHGGGMLYPLGDGMVERLGMGSRKLDSACYLIAGLRALAHIAAAIGAPDAAGYAEHAEAVRVAFERDWWLEEEGLYADSMHSDGRLQLDGHWTIVLPVQLGLAAPERAARVLRRIEADFTNQWGLVHTRAADERVWTLPTGLLALAAFQHGHAARGLELTRAIARTAEFGTLGTFKELIPEGLCFVQLWSAGLYLQAIIEGLLGLRPDAVAHTLTVAPCMPADLAPVRVENLRLGDHTLSLTIAPRSLLLEHQRGPQPLAVTYDGVTLDVRPGHALEQTIYGRGPGPLDAMPG